MKVFRKALFACIASLAVIGPAMLPTQHPANSATVNAAQTRYYYVYYRSCVSDPWYFYGYTSRQSEAIYAVRWIQYFGYDAFYR